MQKASLMCTTYNLYQFIRTYIYMDMDMLIDIHWYGSRSKLRDVESPGHLGQGVWNLQGCRVVELLLCWSNSVFAGSRCWNQSKAWCMYKSFFRKSVGKQHMKCMEQQIPNPLKKACLVPQTFTSTGLCSTSVGGRSQKEAFSSRGLGSIPNLARWFSENLVEICLRKIVVWSFWVCEALEHRWLQTHDHHVA